MKFWSIFVAVTLTLSVFAPTVCAEADQWGDFGVTYQVIAGLNVTQNTYDNWAAGGEDALAYTLTLNSKIEKNRPKYIWTVTGDFAFGQTKQGDDPVKNALDKISVEGLYTYKLGAYVNPYVGLGFDTQFTKGYDYSQDPKVSRSNFLDPIYIMGGAGAGFFLKPNLKTRLGLAFKETRADKFANFYTDDPETPAEVEKSRFETGLESVTDFNAKLGENLLYETKLGLFSAFEHLDVVDIKWDNKWTAQVAKYVSVNLNILIYYDEDIVKKTQIKETLAIGLTYTLF
ncbi:MAG: DUF3078 domain-containing protein [Gemmatimonadota bacterium]|nr:MAG: DUF3078 domain-containing protein [Gemmatimonadota bacterium]